jgi:hypothetical protein
VCTDLLNVKKWDGVGTLAYRVIFLGVFNQNFFSVGVHQIQLRVESRENGDLGAVAT